MDVSLIVQPEHFDYLKIQKGNLDQFAHNFPMWRELYEMDIDATYASIRPHLPIECERFLDVGSGLGGIDVLIRRHYERAQEMTPEVHLLDGLDDPPKMHLHRETFNSMRIARNFQVKNGLLPMKLKTHGPKTAVFLEPFDLVVSFGSWCFHFPPDVYLPALLAGGLTRDTILILDVRSGKPDYFEALERVLEVVTHVTFKPKWSRVVFKVKPGALK